ncbi:hypothetical protein MKC69_23905 [[Clostridium] innocuum]|nr:hypothetical protein [[Clostridium] innocuum]
MEITREEYENMKQQIEALQRQIDNYDDKQLNKTSIRRTIVDAPITGVYADYLNGRFEYNRSTTGVWELFIKMAKELTRDLPRYRERKNDYRYRGEVYNCFDNDDRHKIQKLFCNFTDEEFRAASNMLNEMSVIYNKYYKQLHPTVKVHLKEMDNDEYEDFELKDIFK